ncbi:MAG: DUF362 domain-containing protein [Planctomycetota bacterium]
MIRDSRLALTRREFVKSTALGTVALGLGPTIFVPSAQEPDFAAGGFIYHPHLDPLRVVGLHDAEMITEEKPTAPWKVQEKLVRAGRVAENIDRLACALAAEKSPKEAWKKIFLKPPGKEWNETLIAIKTNNIALQHTHSGVMTKICRVLIEEIGAKAANIFIYDGCHGGDMVKKTPFEALPEGCNVAATWGGFAGKTRVGEPWKGGKSETACVKPFAEAKVDILVNIALCKGHSQDYGGFTMLCKNHFGTFIPRPGHEDGGTDYLFAINKTPLVLGEIDAKESKVTFPRQQLCLIDALWASEDGPGCESSVQPSRLYMGTFAPVADYLVARNFREKEMGWGLNETVTKRFLSEFGYSPDDLHDGGKIIEVERG